MMYYITLYHKLWQPVSPFRTNRTCCPLPLTGTRGFQLSAIKFQGLKPANKHTVEVKLRATAQFAVCTAGGLSETTVQHLNNNNQKKTDKKGASF